MSQFLYFPDRQDKIPNLLSLVGDVPLAYYDNIINYP